MQARKRIQRELAQGSSAPDLITSRPSGPEDLLTLHYALRGPVDTPYEGGVYHGLLKFPDDYPLKPPGIIMLTPSGRFEVGMRLCLSMSECVGLAAAAGRVTQLEPLPPTPLGSPPSHHPAPLLYTHTRTPPPCQLPPRALAAHLEPRQDPPGAALLHGL
jgi:hypothetical protein